MNGRELVAWNVRRLRVEKGVSQERLALEASVDPAYLSGVERRQENPTVDLLDRLAAALSAPTSALFVEPSPGAAPPKSLPGGRRPTAGKL